MNENRETGMERGEEPVGEHGRTAKEQEEYEAYWLAQYTEEVISKEKRKDCEQLISDLKEGFDIFEAEVPVEELRAITTAEEALKHPMRERAKRALDTIVDALNYLEKETNITPERHAELFARYIELTEAVGMIITAEGTVRHKYEKRD